MEPPVWLDTIVRLIPIGRLPDPRRLSLLNFRQPPLAADLAVGAAFPAAMFVAALWAVNGLRRG